jgi:hypothetical protein
MVTETNLKEKKHGVIWWLCVGWWWLPIKWLVFTLPALLIALFKPKKYKTETRTKKMAVCNNCGKSWKV